jgi:hypothetical protein
VATISAIAIELREQLFIQEKELDSWEHALTTREDDLAASECALGRVHVEYDAKCDWVEAVQQDYRARLGASIAGCRGSFDFNWILRGHQC